jgi:ABC-2 type transport system ATP-binding protein
MIEVENLTKRYGDVTAVNSITFTAEHGQVTGFLGPNGAGKTTTMRMLTGFMPPTSGKALVAGHDVFDDSMAVRQRVGYLPENVPLYRDMSARSYLMYIAEIRGVRNRRDRVDDVLERVGLLNRAGSRIRTLSKGMRQRVGLAQALLHDPEVLILDEPTIGLDPLQVLELRDLVRELGRDRTLLFSTHILSEAEQVCDKVVIINRGQIVAQGSPVDLRGMLGQGGRVLTRVDAPYEVALPIIEALPSVDQAEVALGGIVVTPKSATVDPRPDIARAIVAQQWNLIELRPLATNLEEIFLEVTRRQEQAEPAETPATEPADASATVETVEVAKAEEEKRADE